MRDTQSIELVRIRESTVDRVFDDVVVEEPLEIRVNGESIGITMRTPGDDFDLATGLLWTEGFIRSASEVGTIAYCPDEQQPEVRNVVNVTLADSYRRIESGRKTWANSSCGLGGKATIESIRASVRPIESRASVDRSILSNLPGRMRLGQSNFERTGGIHAAGLFETNGRLVLIREDLGRHNAVDKLLGAALRQEIDVGAALLMVSGRLGFEIAQKAAIAGIHIVASVSAPSSLALELAADLGITAVGFVRDGSMNVYTHSERILNGLPEHPA